MFLGGSSSLVAQIATLGNSGKLQEFKMATTEMIDSKN